MRRIHDWWLTVSFLLAALTSLTILFSISPDRLITQAVWLIIGFVLYLYLSSQDSAVYSALSQIAFPLSIILLFLTFLVGDGVRGSTRWISFFGFGFQTSEIVKPLLALSFARFLTERKLTPLNTLLLTGTITLPLLFILKQPDLGTGLVITALVGAQIILAGAPLWLYLVGIVLGYFGLRLAPSLLHDYQLARLESFVDPTKDPLGSGYNVIQSIIAVGSGGLFGKGLGHGTQSHLRFLPERHTDFVFASLVEELGFLGGIFVLAVLGIILYRLCVLMLTAKQREQRLILVGIFAYLLFQSFVNIGMNLGIAPVTGVTLPLISYGGSSILGISLSLGIAGSISNSLHSGKSLEIK